MRIKLKQMPCEYCVCSGDEDSDDETAELMRELDKIKKERAAEEDKKV